MQINKCSMKKYDPEVIINSLSLFSVCSMKLFGFDKRRAYFGTLLNFPKGFIQ